MHWMKVTQKRHFIFQEAKVTKLYTVTPITHMDKGWSRSLRKKVTVDLLSPIQTTCPCEWKRIFHSIKSQIFQMRMQLRAKTDKLLFLYNGHWWSIHGYGWKYLRMLHFSGISFNILIKKQKGFDHEEQWWYINCCFKCLKVVLCFLADNPGKVVSTQLRRWFHEVLCVKTGWNRDQECYRLQWPGTSW